MSTNNRREKLRDHIQASGFAALGELACLLDVSESTIRRDLESLEEAGEARRTHGGVYWTGQSATISVFQSRQDDAWPRKQAIGQIADTLIEDGDTILLDGGSTVYELARRIVNRPLQVVTNSLPVAHLLSTSDSIDLIMVGGCVRGRTSVAIGPMADTMLAGINVSKTFLSVAGVTKRGFFNSDMMLVESEKAMIAAADQTIVLTDHTKFGKVSLSQICGLQDVDRVVTDTGLDSKWNSVLETAGVELMLASSAEHADPNTSRKTSQNHSGGVPPLNHSPQSGSSISS
ncbi:DeoR/GlpR family DNA-binding transcription regulator [Rubripirellula obstinata]|uniref:DeoR/GlpR family DNA-binding transcription regulator n=1 Tax=Rubripirellula obstinata TaxID=406547 RepID=UPI00082B6E80|nr:DeoR/GlpR family DNA-binding transcription regulator [Rubripirellula obstinata]